ncbi:MAG: peroxiredoxin [Candidatus Bipolaricaulota bacterium]|nr:peroxiredoxin [Candidatus Bipolaricaulota bacterium]
MSLINVGTKAPGFVLSDQHGEKVDLKSLQGRRVILSFHPLAFTPVCAKQMKALEDNREEFEKMGAVALGISVDSVPAKHAWARDLGVKSTQLLSDFWPHGAVASSYRIFSEDGGYSKRSMIILDEEGIVRFSKVYPISEVPDMGEILEQLKKLGG